MSRASDTDEDAAAEAPETTPVVYKKYSSGFVKVLEYFPVPPPMEPHLSTAGASFSQ